MCELILPEWDARFIELCAGSYEGIVNITRSEDYDWRLEWYDVSRLKKVFEADGVDTEQWIEEECANFRERFYLQYVCSEDIPSIHKVSGEIYYARLESWVRSGGMIKDKQPIVVIEVDDKPSILWDGWHRSAVALNKGIPYLLAVVGNKTG